MRQDDRARVSFPRYTGEQAPARPRVPPRRRQWSRPVAAAGLGLALLVGTAPALGRPMAGFGAPRLDGVTAGGAVAGPDLRTYVFRGGQDWPALRFTAPQPLDWRGASALALPVENPGDAGFALLLRLDDDPAADGGDRSLTGTVEVPPHTRTDVVLPLGGTLAGMRGQPSGSVRAGPGDLVMAERRGTVDLGRVVALHVSGVHPAADATLLIGRPALRDGDPPSAASQPLSDAFGQAVAGSWPEKVESTADLRRKLDGAATQSRRLARATFPVADRYGGVSGGPVLPATGFFTTAFVGGRWALVTPAGHRFFSLGVDGVEPENPTIVAGRERLFAGLPKGVDTWDVGTSNLARALGPDWRRRWPDRVTGRLRAWGFNTLGAWSAPDVVATAHMPYVDFTDIDGDTAHVPMPGGRALPDPFDPRFAVVADSVAQAIAGTRRGDPFLIGRFSGNELPWGRTAGDLAAAVMRLDGASPAKRAFVAELRGRYGTVQTLAAAYRLDRVTGWDEVAANPFAWPAGSKAAARDAGAFAGRFAELYFSTAAGALKRYDPDHLYLGTRFAAGPPEVLAACARHCDVLGFNVYGRSPAGEAARWRDLGRPVLIGEFHFGSIDRGSFWAGMAAVPNEAARGPAYAEYVEAAAADPAIVGLHWFRYADEPLTGRPYDGENGHIGLVAVTDVPFSGFVEAVAAANRAAMARFASPGAPPPRVSQAPSGGLGLRGTR